MANLIRGSTSFRSRVLATVHWAHAHEKKGNTVDEVEDFVRTWSSRKSKLLKSEHLKLAYRRLEEFDWLAADRD